ncbi:MAG TPA: DUF721 domain-containing protein [Desulfomicrobiaceae bacterium]|nr:DUF721 domain-containing protein [Desulfomicrobiaceae bacterium]
MKRIQDTLSNYLSRNSGPVELRLVRLWKTWPEVIGPDMAELLSPLGHRKHTLVLGAEDSMIIQEFSFFAPEILEKVNTALGQAYFDKVHIELLSGKAQLDRIRQRKLTRTITKRRPENLGRLLDRLPADTPAGRAYRKYLRHFDENE